MMPLRCDLIHRKDSSEVGSYHGGLVNFAQRCAASPDGKADIKVRVFNRQEDGKRHYLSPWIDPTMEAVNAWLEEERRLLALQDSTPQP